MPFWLRFIIYALAVYRFTLLLHEDDGPGHIFTRLRAMLGVQHGVSADGEMYTVIEGFWAEVVSCPYCLSGWISLLAVLGLSMQNQWIDLWAIYGAVWGIAHYLYKQVGY